MDSIQPNLIIAVFDQLGDNGAAPGDYFTYSYDSGPLSAGTTFTQLVPLESPRNRMGVVSSPSHSRVLPPPSTHTYTPSHHTRSLPSPYTHVPPPLSRACVLGLAPMNRVQHIGKWVFQWTPALSSNKTTTQVPHASSLRLAHTHARAVYCCVCVFQQNIDSRQRGPAARGHTRTQSTARPSIR